MLPELPKALIDWAQLVSAVLSLLAILVALFTLWKQRRDQIKDRVLQEELATWRELQAAVESATGGRLQVANPANLLLKYWGKLHDRKNQHDFFKLILEIQSMPSSFSVHEWRRVEKRLESVVRSEVNKVIKKSLK